MGKDKDLSQEKSRLLENIDLKDMAGSKDFFDSLSFKEQQLALEILEELENKGNSGRLKELYDQDYDEYPVDIHTFVTDEHYMGGILDDKIYPLWLEHMETFLSPTQPIIEVVLTGSIGSGKTTIGLISVCYHLHRILCLKNPQEYYGLLDSDEIVFAIFNATLDLASNVGMDKISKMIRNAPFFSEKLIDNPRAPEQINFPKNISIEVGSQFSHTLGKHVFAALLDEANFQENSSVDQKDSQVMKSYNALYRRMESRFLGKGGSLPGQLFMISSKNNKTSFLEVHIEQNQNRDTTYVIDEPIWEFKKHLGNYSGETFRVMLGDQQRDSKILPKGDKAPEGYEVIDVPEEYRLSFERDIDSALKDIAGKATYSDVNLVKNRARVREGIVHNIEDLGEWKSPFTTDLVVLDFDDDDTEIRDYIDIPYFNRYLDIIGRHQPRAIHIDIGVTGDALGIAMGFTEGKREIIEVNLEGEQITREKELYRMDFQIRITNLEGKELPLHKIITFIVWLRKLGVNIRMCSTDGYQSTMLRQLLRKRGFDTDLVSVDKTDDAYIYLKDAHMDKRILFYSDDVYLLELFDLLHFSKKQKVDHPRKNAKGGKGSKDVADAVCGVIYDLVNDKQEIKNADRRPIDYGGYLDSDDMPEEDFEKEVLNFAMGDYLERKKEMEENEKNDNSNFQVF